MQEFSEATNGVHGVAIPASDENKVEKPKMPALLQCVAFLYYFGAVVCIFGGGVEVIVGSPSLGRVVPAILFVLGFIGFYGTRELLRGKNWARWYFIIGNAGVVFADLVQFFRKVPGIIATTPLVVQLHGAALVIFISAVLISLVPFLWFVFVPSYLFFNKRIKGIYEVPSAQDGMPKKLIWFLAVGILLGIILLITFFFSPFK
jgi:hypothetical protein